MACDRVPVQRERDVACGTKRARQHKRRKTLKAAAGVPVPFVLFSVASTLDLNVLVGK